MDPLLHRIAPETPTAGRTFSALAAGLVVVSSLVAGPAWARQILTESDVVRLARARAPDSVVADAALDLADADALSARLLPNPRLEWERESSSAGEGSVQDVLRATLPIDVARTRSARALAASTSTWTRAEAAAARSGAVLEAVLAYYDVLVSEQQVAILEEAAETLDEAARILAVREAAGTASGYESARLAIARELAQSRVAEARGAARASRERLATLLDVDSESLHAGGSLALSILPSEADLAQRAAERELILFARASARSAAEAEARAAWSWIPAMELSAGPNLVRESDRGYGYVSGLSIGIPLFDRGQALRAEARAQRNLADARTGALSRTVRGGLAGDYALYETARAELERFEAATSEPVEALLKAAHTRYREGQAAIVELLDAQRARTEVAERRLELLAAAKRAEARVRAAAGELR